ncbi:MAG: response regulator [Deltaproteobacteria bacterium]|nr:response regulator [Deltaproteobacteria bacterium]
MIEEESYRLKVLYVEDDESTQEEVINYLKRRHYQVLTEGNGRLGLELYYEKKPDIVVSDIRMPEMDGLQMLSAIRKDNPQIPTIVMTAFNDVGYLHEAITLGVDGYVLKPINLQIMLETVEKCSQHVLARRNLAAHQREREKLIEELNEALEKVQVLKGIIPICCNCKKIRDDQGYWDQVEAYISKHSEARFSHGICPDCVKKIYPEFED